MPAPCCDLRLRAASAVALLALAAGGCSTGPATPGTQSSSADASAGATASAAASPSEPDASADLAAMALREGVVITSHGVALRVLAASTPRVLDDSSVRVDIAPTPSTAASGERRDTGSTEAAPPTPARTLVVAAPAPLRLAVLGDGTALVLDGDVPVAGLRADPSGRLEARGEAAVLVPQDEPTSLWFTGRSILDLVWGEREGGRSLAVTPADWTRAGGRAAEELAAAQLAAADAEAGSPTMLQQLACHQLGARSKATWNLEPWRPDVDPFEMIAARCNPT
ncbi:DUF2599 domain-containing protein [Cellulomonas persica]|uniref:DUF2599 domain-containing protein n=1 Tax=Cellulomonas persica TaxID=76861 RepID=A0A510URM6_9CELL|nr:DUF2599 domain-containing protein [Cellulomonas persica]GEK17318.1 hypothetical protein CPE01_10510 [Cellulomonas persica]